MSVFINSFVLLFITIILGRKLGEVRIKERSLGAAMILLAGIFVSYLVGTYIYSLSTDSQLYITGSDMMDNSIVTNNVLTVFLVFFISGVGLIASKELIPVLKKFGLKFLAIAIIITSVGVIGTYAVGRTTGDYTTFELSGVFSGSLSSTPGMTAGIESSRSQAEDDIANFDSLSESKKNAITEIVGEPDDSGFSQEQEVEYMEFAITGTGIGYTITFPFGNLLVLLAINIMPILFKIDIDKEREEYEKNMKSIQNIDSGPENDKENVPKGFDIASYFFVLAVGFILGLVRIGSFALSATGGVLIASLALGSLKKWSIFDFDFDDKVLNAIREIGMVGTLAATGLRLGYPVINALTGTYAVLALYATIIGLLSLLAGYVVGRYVFKMNWMMLSGALCGGMTNTSGLGVAVDATKSDYPSIGYAATYPFAVVMMVIYTVLIQGFNF